MNNRELAENLASRIHFQGSTLDPEHFELLLTDPDYVVFVGTDRQSVEQARDRYEAKASSEPVTYETNPGGLAAAEAARADVATYFRK